MSVDDSSYLAKFLWPGNTDAATSMLSFNSSMTLTVLQVASGNFSHQLLRDFIASRAVRGILAVYIGLFAYVITVPRAMIGIFTAVATFIWYVSRVVDMVRMDTVISASAQRTIELARPFQSADDERHARPQVPSHAKRLRASTFGYVRSIDLKHAADWAKENEGQVVIDVRPGDPVLSGWTLGWYWGQDETEEMPMMVYLDSERSSGQYYSLGLQQILDTAVRALSPGVNDPTTAVHSIWQGARTLREFAEHPVAPSVRKNDDDELIVWAAALPVSELLKNFVNCIRRYAGADPTVSIALLRLLDSVEDVDREAMGPVIERQRERIIAQAKRLIEDEADLQAVIDASSTAFWSTHKTGLP